MTANYVLPAALAAIVGLGSMPAGAQAGWSGYCTDYYATPYVGYGYYRGPYVVPGYYYGGGYVGPRYHHRHGYYPRYPRGHGAHGHRHYTAHHGHAVHHRW